MKLMLFGTQESVVSTPAIDCQYPYSWWKTGWISNSAFIYEQALGPGRRKRNHACQPGSHSVPIGFELVENRKRNSVSLDMEAYNGFPQAVGDGWQNKRQLLSGHGRDLFYEELSYRALLQALMRGLLDADRPGIVVRRRTDRKNVSSAGRRESIVKGNLLSNYDAFGGNWIFFFKVYYAIPMPWRIEHPMGPRIFSSFQYKCQTTRMHELIEGYKDNGCSSIG